MPQLKSLTIHGVHGNSFDRHTFSQCFPRMTQLEEFSYALQVKTAFELRDLHLQSLAQTSGHTLRRLVLLECNRLTSTVIAQCLDNLPNLEYFALFLVTVEELNSNFLLSLSNSVQVLKLQVLNAWYATALLKEERILCDTVEEFLRYRPLHTVAVQFRSSLFDSVRVERCKSIAAARGIWFTAGSWAETESL